MERRKGRGALDRPYNKRITCCFTGHRPEKLPWGKREAAPECLSLKERLMERLRELYQKGYRHFICGMAKGADTYFAEAVLALRTSYPDIILEAAIPCPTQADHWRKEDRERYQAILAQCDLETLVQQHYDRFCMHRRNRYMVEHSSLLLAVYDGMGGGTLYTINYAMNCGLEVVLLEPV